MIPDPENRFTGLPIHTEYLNGVLWRIKRDCSYRIAAGAFKGHVSTVRVGFETDWASTPRLIWWWLPPAGVDKQPWGVAAVWHDWLYAHQAIMGIPCTRRQADEVLLEIMLYVGVRSIRARLMYRSVRLCGWRRWRKLSKVQSPRSKVQSLKSSPRPLAAHSRGGSVQPSPSTAQEGQIEMQTLPARMQTHPAAAANSTSLAAANQVVLASPKFTVMQDGLFVPFGDFDHEVGIQRWDEEAANSLIAELRADPAGRPVYRGHPDVPDLAHLWPDRDAKGWVKDAEIVAYNGERGVKFRPRYNADGVDIIENAKLKFPSPFWALTVVGTGANGRPIVRPTRLISIGLVNNPNIPVPAVANGAPLVKPTTRSLTAANTEDKMRDKLISMLQAASVEVPADATDEQLLALVEQTMTAAQATANEATQTAEEEKAKAEAEKTNAANARKLAAGALVDRAIVEGKLPKAQREAVLIKFETNFAAANSALEILQPVIPMGTPQSDGVAARNAQVVTNLTAANARAELKGLVEVEEHRLRGLMPSASGARIHELAWANTQRNHKELYTQSYTKE